jgi:hypothetical protein
MRLPFAVQSYTHRALPISAQRLINLFPEVQPENAKSRLPLLPTPGLRLLADLGVNAVRGVHVMGGDLYAVAGSGVYRVTQAGVATLLGNIGNGGPVSLDSNGSKLCIVAPENYLAWVVDRATGTITQITDPDFGGATAVTVIDGYYVFTKPNTTEFFLSGINDPLSFNALDFASAEGAPDNLVAPVRVGRDLWLFGDETIEVWSNVGATDFPFLRVSGGFVARGTAARFSIATRIGTAVWLGDDRVVYAAAGIQPQRISTHAIEQAVGAYTRVNDAIGYVYEQEGHAFYVLSFPDAGDTWVYDFATQLWHERESEGVNVWRAALGCAFAGGVVAGDAVNGRLWVVDPTYMLEGDDQIIRVATGTAFHAEGRKVEFTRLAADFETGVGITTGQGSDPKAWLSWSNDGGRTFGNAAEARLGAIGQYLARMEWRRLGQSRDRVFRMQWADPVFTSLIAMNIDAEAGND